MDSEIRRYKELSDLKFNAQNGHVATNYRTELPQPGHGIVSLFSVNQKNGLARTFLVLPKKDETTNEKQNEQNIFWR